jgi:hypothetical protein
MGRMSRVCLGRAATSGKVNSSKGKNSVIVVLSFNAILTDPEPMSKEERNSDIGNWVNNDQDWGLT